MKILLSSLIVAALPAFAASACDRHEQSAGMSCAEGTVYDAQAHRCVPTTG